MRPIAFFFFKFGPCVQLPGYSHLFSLCLMCSKLASCVAPKTPTSSDFLCALPIAGRETADLGRLGLSCLLPEAKHLGAANCRRDPWILQEKETAACRKGLHVSPQVSTVKHAMFCCFDLCPSVASRMKMS